MRRQKEGCRATLRTVFKVCLLLCSFSPEEKPVQFRLKPPTLIHGQAPSSGWCLSSVIFSVWYYLTLTSVYWGKRTTWTQTCTRIYDLFYRNGKNRPRASSCVVLRRAGSLTGIPSQKPKEQQRSVLRPAVLQAPPSKSHIESSECNLESPASLLWHLSQIKYHQSLLFCHIVHLL